MDIEIRKMELTDLDQIEDILESDFDDFWNASIFKQELQNENSYYLVAILDGEVVGFAGYMLILDEADITNVVVRKDMRNRGIATKLLERLLDLIEPMSKIELITLEVNENNEPAIKLYEKFGFNQEGLRKNYYKDHQNALILSKKLIRL